MPHSIIQKTFLFSVSISTFFAYSAAPMRAYVSEKEIIKSLKHGNRITLTMPDKFPQVYSGKKLDVNYFFKRLFNNKNKQYHYLLTASKEIGLNKMQEATRYPTGGRMIQTTTRSQYNRRSRETVVEVDDESLLNHSDNNDVEAHYYNPKGFLKKASLIKDFARNNISIDVHSHNTEATAFILDTIDESGLTCINS